MFGGWCSLKFANSYCKLIVYGGSGEDCCRAPEEAVQVQSRCVGYEESVTVVSSGAIHVNRWINRNVLLLLWGRWSEPNIYPGTDSSNFSDSKLVENNLKLTHSIVDKEHLITSVNSLTVSHQTYCKQWKEILLSSHSHQGDYALRHYAFTLLG